MTGRTFLACAAGLLLGAAACGDDAEVNGDGGGGASSSSTAGSTSATDASSNASSGSGGDTGAGGAGGGDAQLPFIEYGVLRVERGASDQGDGTADSTYVGASFQSAPEPTTAPFAGAFGMPSAWCTTETFGACVVFTCEPGVDADWYARSENLTAGVLTIDGLSSPLVLEPTDDTYFGLEPDPDDLVWSDGDAIVFSAEGGDVPAFSVEVVAPAAVTLASPPAFGAEIDSGEDLALTWSHEGEAGRVELSLVGSDETRTIEILCDAAAVDDGLVVPSAALAFVRGEALFLFWAIGSGEVVAGDVAVRAELREYFSTSVAVN